MRPGQRQMRKLVATRLRCVPRFGFSYADVRTIDVDLPVDADEQQLIASVETWFAHRGIADAVYGIDSDENGFLAIVNDEAFHGRWGEPLL